MAEEDAITGGIIIPEAKNLTISKEIVKADLPTYLTKEEVRAFLSAIPPTRVRDTVFFHFLLGTAKRISEVLGLQKRDIDFETRLIRIRQLKKHKLTYNMIRINKDLALLLFPYVAALPTAESRVFPYTRNYADQLCKVYAEKSGLTYKRVSCHIFRHTWCIWFLESGGDLRIAQKQLGHSNIAITIEQYGRVVDSRYNQVIDDYDYLPRKEVL